ncbi:DNA adenine methylase, partial [Listeria monocytogenes]|nr:DNA adenine methylase [Listeria monocytogenes]
MPRTSSPLRYPGGKTQLSSFVKNLLEINNIVGGTYIEPFAGGAGVAIQL